MANIHQRVVASKYQTLEDMVADFVLMFDNACKYNEPDSLIYKVRLTVGWCVCFVKCWWS